MKRSPRLTDDEKKLFGPMLNQVWQAIGPDVEASLGRTPKPGVIAEIVCDANHPEMYGGFTREQAERLSESYFNRDTQKWLRKELNY